MKGPFARANAALVEAIDTLPASLDQLSADEENALAALLISIQFLDDLLPTYESKP